jgi:cell division transport system permease protein
MKQLPAVDDVETYQSWTERLARLVRGGVAASGLLAVVVLFAVLAVVGSTMRMALQRRKTEVEVLKLVGATDGFVKKPYIIEGSLQGALGAAGALALLAVLFLVVRGRLDGELAALIGVEPTFLPWPVAAGMVALGAVLGAAAALASLRKLVAV